MEPSPLVVPFGWPVLSKAEGLRVNLAHHERGSSAVSLIRDGETRRLDVDFVRGYVRICQRRSHHGGPGTNGCN